MNEQLTKIREICEKTASEEGFLFIDIHFRGTENNRVVELFIDSAGNLSVEDCARVSRMISEKIELAGLEKAIGRLDVSSPGADKPLMFLEQYAKHAGRKFNIVCQTPAGEELKLQGKLLRTEKETLFFEDSRQKEFAVNFNSIKESTIVLSFK